MTTTEFSQAFDAQISAYNESIDFATSDKGLSFGEYEKLYALPGSRQVKVHHSAIYRHENEAVDYSDEFDVEFHKAPIRHTRRHEQ